MNKEKLQQDIDAMREKLAEMEAKLKEKEKYFIPKLWEKYWAILTWGEVCLETNDGEGPDIHKIATGNCYRTEEEALKANAKQKAYVRIVRALRDHEEEGCERESIIYYLSDDNDYDIGMCNRYTLNLFGTNNKELLSTLDACKWVIDNMKDDLNLYFGE